MGRLVEFQNVKKTYHMGEVEIHAVDGVDFEINEGEFVVIVGPSGAGKTTVLNILGGMDKATSGHVIVDGVDISSFNSRQPHSSFSLKISSSTCSLTRGSPPVSFTFLIPRLR